MDETFLKSLMNPQYTQDLYMLEQSPKHLVFDCGPVMFDADYYGTAFTVERLSLFLKNEQNRPALAVPIRMGESAKARVRGTLYCVSTEELTKLDKIKQNGVWFKREQVPIMLPMLDKLREPTRLQKPVWMYQGIQEYWEDRITWDMSFRKRGEPEYAMAGKFQSNIRYFHNHYGYDGLPAECLNLPESLQRRCTAEMQKHMVAKNEKEMVRLRQSKMNKLQRMLSYLK